MRPVKNFVQILLAYKVAAGPILQIGLPTAARNLSLNGVSYDTNPPPPGGPDDFKIMVGRPTAALNRESSLMYVAKVLMDESLQDFHGSFEDATRVFRDGIYPNLAVKATILESGHSRPRRYFFWGMARIISFMVDRGQFFERDFLLVWRDAHVGRITWTLVDIPRELMIGHDARTLAQTATNQTKATSDSASGENALTWRYSPYGELMTITDIAMGTIASLIQAAQLPGQNFESFVGYWPQSNYQATQSWGSEARPSQLSKYVLVRSMFASLTYAHVSRNFHELFVEVGFDYQQVFAKGGYTRPGAPVAGNRLNVTIS
ncbi:MAG: hypothetical protein HETSPECPRED_006875 [Heterodermia speciosa]|uniref:Uncharacterized protein n=1 Tax=Heterodermia speciosa TaxID=116794 RepID=A0A8H3IHT9_9LECA|nr:MAG: hypothetical protein HETSPECPRED_006875 [Heterodermia speciosa]